MSLTDSLIAIFIFVLIMGILIGVYLTYNNVFKIQVAYNELNSTSTIAFDRISKNIRAAATLVESHTINSTEYTTDSDTLILQIPSIDADQDIIFDTYDYLAYYKDGSLLKIDLEANPSSSRNSGIQTTASFVDSIIFNYNKTDYSQVSKVEIILVNTKTVSNQQPRIIMQSTVQLRNI